MTVILWISSLPKKGMSLFSGIFRNNSNIRTGCNSSVAVASISFTINLCCCLFVVKCRKEHGPFSIAHFLHLGKQKRSKLGCPHYQEARGRKRATSQATSGWPSGAVKQSLFKEARSDVV